MIKIPIPVLGFAPPMNGLDGTFNTFRLGLSWSKRVKKGDYVLLLDERTKIAFARAKVTGVHTGTLWDMALLYAAQNHNQRHDPANATNHLIASVIKRYGPHKVDLHKRFTVVELRRMKR